MSKMMFAAAAVAALLGGQAIAAETPTLAVNTAGVNFDSRADVQRLYARLNEAALKVCSTDSKNKYIAAPDRACVETAVARAVRTTDRPLLTAAYQERAPGVASSAMATNDQ